MFSKYSQMLAGVIATSLLTIMSAQAEPQRYELDPDHTTVAFMAQHLGYADTLGLFLEVEGSFTYDQDTQDLSDVVVTVQTASVETFNGARNNHLRSKDFLSAKAHPVMRFAATSGTPAGDTTGTVTGDLSLLGQTLPLTLDVTLNKADKYPFGHQKFTLGLSARGTVKRSSYGMIYGVEGNLVGDEVQVIIETEANLVE